MELLNSRRDRLQIFAEILDLCRKPQTKTRVMYETNLSYTMLQDCLKKLQNQGLLEVHHSEVKYATTEKGLQFLQRWVELQQFLKIEKSVHIIVPRAPYVANDSQSYLNPKK